ncbi:diaminopimelate decarboxylase [Candidatus Entotheonella palauensis]|uniref:diaminopimelate decarboxylase n=1 Tax=Candidatus Entotheonella palauensis TaxID=93172 RepID=UPI000B7E88AE|nr:diaminopimelate decarboxylase [Candidatus Entotheonella palauensis]
MAMPDFQGVDLNRIAERIGTPFHLYDAQVVQARIDNILALTAAPGLQARYAMKACSARQVLERMRAHGIWIDAVSGNEVLRAQAAGYDLGADCPEVLLTTDVFRDNALDMVHYPGVLPNLGSPGMVEQLEASGYTGPIALRLNPGFGHGHVQACDTGGPSSKHGIWFDAAATAAREAERRGMQIVLLHAHVGTGPEVDEFYVNMQRLVDFFADRAASYPHLQAINLGGGIPHSYRENGDEINLAAFAEILQQAQQRLTELLGRPIRVEVEPGRYVVAPSACVVTRVTDIKRTETNDKGPGHTFVMVDAGFNDLVRPAMYGSFHQLSVWQAPADALLEPVVVAGPLCESGDVFTRDSEEFLQPRPLPPVHPGDLMLIHDAGAYGIAMSSNYVSLGRAPQVWVEDEVPYLMSRRETFEDVVRTECFTAL